MPGSVRVVTIILGVFRSDTDSAGLGYVPVALLKAVVKGVDNGLAVDSQSKGLSYFLLLQLWMPDVVCHQGVDLVVGTSDGSGYPVDVLESDFEGQVGFAGGYHGSPNQFLVTPDLEHVLD